MTVNASSPTAVNNAIMAAADQILAGMKGGNFFSHHEEIVEDNDVAAAKSEQHASARHSPTAVYHPTGTGATSTVAHTNAETECYVNVCQSSSQVTFDSKEEVTATDNGGGGAADLNKINSALSLTSSEVSHPSGSGPPVIPVQGHQHHVQLQHGPPMQQVTFPTSTSTASTAAVMDTRTGTKRSATTMEAASQKSQEEPPAQKPHLSPSKDGSLPPGSLVVGPTQVAGTPVAQEQPGLLPQQTQLLHRPHSPSADVAQAPGQVTFQPILPALPAMAKLGGEVKSKPEEVHQAQVPQEHSTLQSKKNHISPVQPPPAPVHASGHVTADHQVHPPPGPGPSLVSAEPLAGAQTPVALCTPKTGHSGSRQPVVGAQQPHFAQLPKPTEWETKMVAQPQPPAPSTVVATPHRMALPPIYPKPCPAVQYHSHYQPPPLRPSPTQTAHNAMQSYPPPPPPPAPKQQHPPPSHQGAMASMPPHTTYHVVKPSISLDHSKHNHHHQATDHTTATSTSGTAATLAAVHSYPSTSTTTTTTHDNYYPHHHYHHPANGYHTTTTTTQSSFAGATTTAAGAPQVLLKPSSGSTAGSWSNVPSYTTATAGQGPTAEASGEDVPNLRNHKMQPTDCLLFAASLLQEGPSKSTSSHTETASATQNAPTLNDSSARMAARPAPVAAQAHLARQAQSILPSLPTAPIHRAHHPSSSCTPHALQHAPKVGTAPAGMSTVQKPPPQSGQPQDLDVLCGRGGLINKHVGNIIYRKVVEHNKKFYQTVQKRHRILVSQSIVHTILNRGGRFLSEETKTITNPDGTRTTVTTWKPVATARAIQKTSQALRERIASSDSSGNDDQNKP